MGLFRYNRCCFGIASNPGLFQRLMENVLLGIEGVVVFFDDIVIAGVNKQEHDKRLIAVLTRLRDNGLRAKVEKCEFFKSEVKFLGFKISKDGIGVLRDKVEAISKVPSPVNLSKFRSFQEMANYYSKFIKNYSDIAAPLYALLKKEVEFVWSRQCDESFKPIKNKLLSSEVRMHYDPMLPVKITCDASPIGVGAVIAHVLPNNVIKPIAFDSRTLSKAERNYSQLDRETFAIIFAIKSFHQYVYGREFLLESDHKPLKYIFGPKKGLPVSAASRTQRWAVF